MRDPEGLEEARAGRGVPAPGRKARLSDFLSGRKPTPEGRGVMRPNLGGAVTQYPDRAARRADHEDPLRGLLDLPLYPGSIRGDPKAGTTLKRGSGMDVVGLWFTTAVVTAWGGTVTGGPLRRGVRPALLAHPDRLVPPGHQVKDHGVVARFCSGQLATALDAAMGFHIVSNGGHAAFRGGAVSYYSARRRRIRVMGRSSCHGGIWPGSVGPEPRSTASVQSEHRSSGHMVSSAERLLPITRTPSSVTAQRHAKQKPTITIESVYSTRSSGYSITSRV